MSTKTDEHEWPGASHSPNTNGEKSADGPGPRPPRRPATGPGPAALGQPPTRGAGGRFAKGNRASPGRPPGRGIVAELRDRLAQDLDQIVVVLCNQALAGDPQSIRILLDRVLPSLRPVELPTPLELPGNDLAEQAQAVVRAVAAGDIAPGQAMQIITAMGGVAKILETTELVKRIEALEEKHVKKS